MTNHITWALICISWGLMGFLIGDSAGRRDFARWLMQRIKPRPAIFATDNEHRVSEHCDAVPWSVIEEVFK